MSLGEHKENNEHFGLKGTKRNHDACTTYEELVDQSDWGYVGETGPQKWDKLFPKACSGRHQSPIDINTTRTIYNPQLKDFVVWFDPPSPGSRFLLHNNGHSVQVNTEGGKFYVSNGGLPNIYSTVQFHFHWGRRNKRGSEHTVDGNASPLEMHIVSYNADRYESIAEAATEPEGLAVLGIMFELSQHDNPAFEHIVEALLQVRDPEKNIKEEIPARSMRAFLPPSPEKYYRYRGSLTTPNCFESVIWTVFKEKQTISRRQLHVFRQVLKPKHHKRHKRSAKVPKAEEAVFDELGITDNHEEINKLRKSLEAKMQADAPATKPEPITVHGNNTQSIDTPSYETHDEHEDVKSHENGKQDEHDVHDEHEGTNHAEEEPDRQGHDDHNGHLDNDHEEDEDLETIRRLFDNYRPVQPLNARPVYRSFPFLDESEADVSSAVSAAHHVRSRGKSSELLNLVFSKTEDGHSPMNIKVVQGERETTVQIPPTEVGNSHIEVTLDIDADTVVNVSARNKVTGKEQHIVIQSPTDGTHHK